FVVTSLGNYVTNNVVNGQISANTSEQTDNGLFVLTFTCPASGTSQIWLNYGSSIVQLGNSNPGTCTQQTDGHWRLGGNGNNGTGLTPGSYFGSTFRTLFYNRVLNPGEIVSNVTVLLNWLQITKGIISFEGNKDNTPFYYAVGDSITGGNL